MPATALAAPRTEQIAARRPAPVEHVGYDVSWPQCGKKLPTGQAFAIVGVNGGTAATTNPCLAEQLVWANKSTDVSLQPKIQLYVNTANPGEVISQITTWPTNNTDKTGYTTNNPHGNCTGLNDMTCSWQSGSLEALARNAAALDGMVKYLDMNNVEVGLYSTAVQWSQIVGTISESSNLNGRGNWRSSGASLENAKANCTVQSLTVGGYILMTQYVQQNWDKNHSCI